MRRFGVALSSILRDAKLRLAPQDEVRDAKLCFAPQEEVRDARLRLTPLKEDGDFGASQRGRGHALIAPLSLAVLIALLPDSAATAADSAPMVSPDRIEDAPSIKPDPYPDFDNFAWRAFIALNWPSLTDPAHRGVPDRAKTLGDSGPRVWETFKARYELFQVGPDGRPIAPKPWATYEAANPCGADVDNREKTLATFTPFMDFNQSAFLAGVGANPLVAQNRTYTRYEGRLNEPEYSALAVHGWSQGQNLPDPAHPADLPMGSIAVKAAWRPLNAADTPAMRARYYVVEDANVVDVAKTLAAGRTVCSKSDVALVGLHIVIRTKERPQGLWGTFEHVDNVPPAGEGEAREPDARQAGAPYSYFDAYEAQAWPLADVRLARHFAGQRGSSAQARSHTHAGGPPASDSRLDHGAEPGLLGAARDQGNRVGALHARRQPMADDTRPAKPAKRRRLFPRPAADGGRAARELSIGGRAEGKLGQHDDRDLLPGCAFKLHVLPPEPIQRARP